MVHGKCTKLIPKNTFGSKISRLRFEVLNLNAWKEIKGEKRVTYMRNLRVNFGVGRRHFAREHFCKIRRIARNISQIV